ncbi:hypothetical protein DPMN_041651 [Dreissena polymorpha]|uniref:Uncharacterized protein n=1 Tax=Dreissena polymorpha TaxID=45954 RepID=A0A9D4HWA2_DREPO|nr:hypothetical protein DPMN_041651 [Dreissena polymorpha]
MNKLVLVLLLVGCVALLTLPPQVEAQKRVGSCNCRQICLSDETNTGSCPRERGQWCCKKR